jgi:polyketide biosynthesis acyl carrier protein
VDREHILGLIKRHIVVNSHGLGTADIDPRRSMKDLGLSSLDIVEVVSSAMRELRIRIPRTGLANLASIDELVDLFWHTKQQQAA